MPSIINALTASGGGVAITGDATGNLALQTAGNTAVTVNTSKGVQFDNCIGVGNATPSTSGAGITFPATQSASTDANTLDDYEEGTFTPVVNDGVTSPTYGSRTGVYTKIGNVVYVSARLTLTGGTANSNGLRISLPFTTANNTSTIYPAGGAYFNTAASNAVSTVPIAIDSQAAMLFVVQNATGQTEFTGSNFGNTGQVNFTLVYQV